MSDRRTVYRICTLCEATCGIAVEVEGDRIIAIRGDKDDPFSQGYICPKATGMQGLHEDPDRLRRPVRKTADGGWQEIPWDEAYALVGERLNEIKNEYGANAIGTYLGNPSAHSLHCMVYLPVLNRALGTKQRYSASTVDQFPKMVSAGLMFGGGLVIPIPDLDRTDHLMILGGNPLASNGSLMTAPDAPGRLKGIMKRGGKVIVMDPRRSETADIASEHHFIRPGTDTYFLLAMVNTMIAENLVDLGAAGSHVNGVEDVKAAIADFTPEAVADRCGVSADTIRRLTREFCAAEKAACYGRIGTTTAQFGTLASWAVDLVNIFSGNLDKPGGALFTRPAAAAGFGDEDKPGKGSVFHRWRSRVRGLGEVFGELPVSTLADEILTEGEGQIRAMVTVAGNPVLSTPHAERLDQSLASLDFMVSVDMYINETTRHADVILPPTDALEHDTYDLALYQLAVRDVAKYSPPVFDKPEDAQHDWEILAKLSAMVMGMGDMEPPQVDDFVLQQAAQSGIPDEGGPWDGLTVDEALEKLGTEPGPHRLLDLLLRTGRYGDGFGRKEDGLSLQKLKDNPHGVDLGPLKPQLPNVLRTSTKKIELWPDLIAEDMQRLRAELSNGRADMLLIGRRHLRSNNSWCHNLPNLVKDKNDRCSLLVSEEDAARLVLETGGRARVTSRVGSIVAPVQVSDEMMPGVVSLPHGYGHDKDGIRMAVAQEHAGVNTNILADDTLMDVPSGTSVLNGIPVTVEPMA